MFLRRDKTVAVLITSVISDTFYNEAVPAMVSGKSTTAKMVRVEHTKTLMMCSGNYGTLREDLASIAEIIVCYEAKWVYPPKNWAVKIHLQYHLTTKLSRDLG